MEQVLGRVEECHGFQREIIGGSRRRCCLIAAGMHLTAQVQADIAIVCLESVVESEVYALAVDERSAADLDISFEGVDISDGFGHGARL